MDTYTVVCSNVGTVFEGDEANGRETYKNYVAHSRSRHGRVSGEEVTLLRNGEPVESYTPEARRERHTYIVAVYDTALAYGGPEEGGWWYDTGSLVRVMFATRNREKARAYCCRLNAKLRSRSWGPNQGKREKSSVLSDGEFQAQVHEDVAPQGYPSERPYYC